MQPAAHMFVSFHVKGLSSSLKPSLRAATYLLTKYDLADLIRRISEFELGVIADVIDASKSLSHDEAEGLYYDILSKPLREQHRRISDALISYVLELAGIDPDAKLSTSKPTGKPKGKAVSYKEHFEALYRIGTGWLGWTPDDTWNASPKEIVEAYKGRQEMLKAIFGGEQPEDETQPNFDRDADATATLKALQTKRVK